MIKVFKTPLEFSNYRKNLSATMGFVPTMGALHEGHLSLVKKSQSENEKTTVSIFVNPLQFGPNEDFDKYPRQLERDIALCEAAGVDVIYAPEVIDMYGANYQTTVINSSVQHLYCGAYRPDHFAGVLTVVLKLFNIINADRAYFGEKDRQQLFLISKMAKDLNIRTQVVGCPIIRDQTGLALSSRNAYLSKSQKDSSRKIFESLTTLRQGLIAKQDWHKMKSKASEELIAQGFREVQYLELVDSETFLPVNRIDKNGFILIAAYMGDTRLIDNIEINP